MPTSGWWLTTVVDTIQEIVFMFSYYSDQVLLLDNTGTGGINVDYYLLDNTGTGINVDYLIILVLVV